MNNDPHHRVEHHQLWIDKVRDGLDKTGSWEQHELTNRLGTLAGLLKVPIQHLFSLTPDQWTAGFERYGLTESPPVLAMLTLKRLGYPNRELSEDDDLPTCEAKVAGALSWCAVHILRSPDTHIMLLDDKTAKAVAGSSNSEVTAAELQHLPHNPCLIEFYRPIEVAEKVKRGVRLRAVGFESVGDTDAPAAVVSFYLDYWQKTNQQGGRFPATICTWFGGFCLTSIDTAVRVQVEIESDSQLEGTITDACVRIARNLWDFVTSRSIRYEQVQRKSRRQSGSIPGRISEPQSKSDREVLLLFISRDSKSPVGDDKTDRPTPRPWDHQIEIAGTFHEFVYCAKCGDLHRHDLLGHACRKCGEVVGPRINLRVEKYWHSPYIKGPEGTPLKNVVQDVRRQKRPG